MQVTVGAEGPFDPNVIRDALERGLTAMGRADTVVFGQGPFIDGWPAGAIIIKNGAHRG